MDQEQPSSRNHSIQSTRTGSPHRLLSNSYPPQRPIHRDHGPSTDVRLADLMDEDEARWMSAMENSRVATPIQGAASSSTAKDERSGTSPEADLSANCRNVTPPLPPLNNGPRHSPTTSRHVHSQQPSTSSAALTALPQRPRTFIAANFAQRVFLAAKSNLLYNYTEHSYLPWRENRTHGAIDVTTLQYMRKHVVQQKLVAQVRALGEQGCWLEIGIGETLRDYCQILRDIDYMETYATVGKTYDPFLITTRRPLEAQLLEESGLAKHNPGVRNTQYAIAGRIHCMYRSSPCSAMMMRLVAMLAVAASILLPFLVAIFTPGYLARIIVVCVCIPAFATIASTLTGIRSSFVMMLTLVYAAALIIFLGTAPAQYSR